MNPLVLLALVGGGLYLATRKSDETIINNAAATRNLTPQETAHVHENFKRIREHGSVNQNKALDDVLKIVSSNLPREEQERLIRAYIGKAIESGAITLAEGKQIMN
jgi:Ca2+-binding EF-hand superfamily protein